MRLAESTETHCIYEVISSSFENDNFPEAKKKTQLRYGNYRYRNSLMTSVIPALLIYEYSYSSVIITRNIWTIQMMINYILSGIFLPLKSPYSYISFFPCTL